MNPLIIAACVVLILLPACIAWVVVIRALYHLHRNNQKKNAMIAAYRNAHDVWTRHLNDELLAKQVARTAYQRKTDQYVGTQLTSPVCRVDFGRKPIRLRGGEWDGPSAA